MKYSYIKILKINEQKGANDWWFTVKKGRDVFQMPAKHLPIIKGLLNKIAKLERINKKLTK